MRYPALAAALLISACGGSGDSDSNPFGLIAQNDAVASNPEPAAGECFDQTPVGDGIGFNGVSECPLPIAQPSAVVEPPQPESAMVEIPAGFANEGGSVLGSWYCSEQPDQANSFMPNLQNRWQLNFQTDMTVILQDGSNSVSTWFYGPSGVVVQFSHTGLTSNYILQESGGISDGGSLCTRQFQPLPVEQQPDTAPVADFLQGNSYGCGYYRVRLSISRTLDGFGNWSGTKWSQRGGPIEDASGTYTLMNDVISFDDDGVFYNVATDGTLTHDDEFTWFCTLSR